MFNVTRDSPLSQGFTLLSISLTIIIYSTPSTHLGLSSSIRLSKLNDIVSVTVSENVVGKPDVPARVHHNVPKGERRATS